MMWSGSTWIHVRHEVLMIGMAVKVRDLRRRACRSRNGEAGAPWPWVASGRGGIVLGPAWVLCGQHDLSGWGHRRSIVAAGLMTCSISCVTRRTLLVAFDWVTGNYGANTAGVDARTGAHVEEIVEVAGCWTICGSSRSGCVEAGVGACRRGRFRADLPWIPPPSGDLRDTIAEIHQYSTTSYRWVLYADIEVRCDSISHFALLERMLLPVKDKRVLGPGEGVF